MTRKRFAVSGVLELTEIDENDQPTVPRPLQPPNAISEWYKSESKSEIKHLDGVLRWQPVKKPTTLHSYHDKVPFLPGQSVVCKFKWRSDGRKGSNAEIDGSARDWSGQGKGISDDYLRCLAGTGDFRIGFFEAADKVYDGTVEGPDVQNPATEFNEYKGFQIRWHPHLSEGFKNLSGRLYEHKDDGDRESHNNLTLWTRCKPGMYGLMSDEAQRHDHSGFSKSDGWGTQPVSWGANVPFGEWVDAEVLIERANEESFSVTFSVDGRKAPILAGNFKPGFAPSHLDCTAITYTNQSRRYEYVEIKDFTISPKTL